MGPIAEKIRRDSKSWSWWSIRPKLEARRNYGRHNFIQIDLECAKSQQINRNHSVTQTPTGVWSSYSGVSKYSPVLQNCKVWASSDHWWWRYTKSYFLWTRTFQTYTYSVQTVLLTGNSVQTSKNAIGCISITTGRMKLIFCSLVVLDSTSKPQNMSSKLPLTLDLWYDFVIFIAMFAAPSLSLRSYVPRNSL